MQKRTFFAACIVFLLTLNFVSLSLAEPPPSIPSQGVVVAMNAGKLFVQKVYQGSAGDKAGLQVGDVLLSVGNTQLSGMTPRDAGYVLDFNPGSTAGISIVRNGVTKFLYLTKDYPMVQWKLAWDQDQMEFARQRPRGPRGPQGMRGPNGELLYGPGQISYATSPSEMQSMGSAAGGPGVVGMEGNGISGGITYDMLYQELMRIRQQLGALAKSIDHLADKIETTRPVGAPSAIQQPQTIVEPYAPSPYVNAPVQQQQQQQAPPESPYRTFQKQQQTTTQDVQQQQDQAGYYTTTVEQTGNGYDASTEAGLSPEVRDILASMDDTAAQKKKSPSELSDDELNAEIEAILHPQPTDGKKQSAAYDASPEATPDAYSNPDDILKDLDNY